MNKLKGHLKSSYWPLLLVKCFDVFISSMINADTQVFTIDRMQKFQLNCSVKNLRTDVSSTWSKQQLENAKPELLFVDSGPMRPKVNDFARYSVSYTTQGNGFLYALQISDTQPQDSGLYLCGILDREGQTVLTMHYTLNVIAAIEKVTLFKNYSQINETTDEPVSPFRYTTAMPGSIGCHVTGGNPQPNVTLSLGSMASLPLTLKMVQKLWSGSSALYQKPSWEVIVYADHLTLLPEHDGETVTCSASVGSYNISTSNKILVDTIPYFYSNGCKAEQYTVTNAKKAQISCRFHAHPAGKVVWAKAKTNGTTDYMQITDADGLQTSILDGTNDFIATLLFPKVTEEIFQFYNLTISNELGSNSTIIKLSKSHASLLTINIQLQILTVTTFLLQVV